jgi:AbrB family looped-hinge helix DNA binding protein
VLKFDHDYRDNTAIQLASNVSVGGTTMQEFEDRFTEKGQVTIPQEIRRLLGLHAGDVVRFEVVGEEVRIRRATSKLLSGFGVVTPKQRPEDFHSPREAFEKGVAEEVVSET